MLEFIPSAFAAPAASPAEPSAIPSILLLLSFVLFMWFFLFRPQRKQRQEHAQMLAALKPGDEIVTSGGIVGRVDSLRRHWVVVEVAEGMFLRIQKRAVMNILPEGTIADDAPAGNSPE